MKHSLIGLCIGLLMALAAARAKPGEVTYGSVGIGSSTHFAAEYFNQSAGIRAMHVPYKGGP